ncbi:mitochondrial carrier [Backusella circina FSU 941]|nr:mitochondrial carrier [Backusella circina FSU 941]
MTDNRLEVKSHVIKANSSTLERIISAFAGSVVTMVFMTPLDVIKTRLQESSNVHYKGTLDGFSKIVRHEGVFALWRSFVPSLAMAVPSTSIYFVGYDYIRDTIKATEYANTNLDIYAPLWAGGIARAVASLAVSPIELFRTRMQSTKGTGGFIDVWNGVGDMVRVQGPQALWRGFLPTMLRDVPFSAFYWMGYEAMKEHLESREDLSHFQVAFISGATSGTVAAAATTPFDVIKTQRQVSSSAEGAKFSFIVKSILETDGSSGFLRGVVPRTLKVAPACAIMISSYEMGKHFFADRKQQYYST